MADPQLSGLSLSETYANWVRIRQGLELATYKNDQERLDTLVGRYQAYHGMESPTLVSDLVDYNVVENYPRLIVDTGVRFLGLGDLEITAGDDDSNNEDEEESPEEEALDAFWDVEGEQPVTLHNCAVSGGIFGQGYIKLEATDDPDRPYKPLVLDPMNMTVRFDPDDYTQVMQYCYVWVSEDQPETMMAPKAVAHQQLITRDENKQSWTIETLIDNNGKWVPDPAYTDTTWPFPWSPIHEWQNLPNPNEYWGIADLEDDILALSRQINRQASNINKIIQLHAHPTIWGKGVTKADMMDAGPGVALGFQNPQAELGILEFSAAALPPAISYWQSLKDGIYEKAGIPPVALGKLNQTGPISGVALQILYAPLVQKSELKRVTLGHAVKTLSEHVLEAQNFGTVECTLNWPEITPVDAVAEREIALLDVDLGASKQTQLEKLGYDPTQEADRSMAEKQQSVDDAVQLFSHGGAPNQQPQPGQPPMVGKNPLAQQEWAAQADPADPL